MKYFPGLLTLMFCCSFVFSEAQSKPAAVRSALQQHDKAVLIKDDIWIRDPYIVLAPDGYYYLTGTTQSSATPFTEAAKYNVGLGDSSRVGWEVRVWKSKDLADWQYMGTPFRLDEGYWALQQPEAFASAARSQWHLWAPEMHFIDHKWVLVHTTPGPVPQGSNLAVSQGPAFKGPFNFPLKTLSKGLHDPSIFQDSDGKVYLVWSNTRIVELTPDLTGFVGTPQSINPSTLRVMGDGKSREGIGNEGCTIIKIAGKYVLLGTGWSTNKARKGSYNLYYAVADSVKGPYGPRLFLGRFLGHGTPFQDKGGRWWCTAFFNANRPPLDREGIGSKDLRDNAYTINKQGVTLVPLEIRSENGTIEFRVLDADYAHPGPDEIQQF